MTARRLETPVPQLTLLPRRAPPARRQRFFAARGFWPSPANKTPTVSPDMRTLVQWQSHVLAWDVNTPAAACLLPLVQKLFVDDVLLSKPWRVELVRMGEGWPHYRLYRAARLVGIADIPVADDMLIRTYKGLADIQRKLCLCLALAGFTPFNSFVYTGEAKTVIGMAKKDLPYLFQ
jgi:hypothetical protein